MSAWRWPTALLGSKCRVRDRGILVRRSGANLLWAGRGSKEWRIIVGSKKEGSRCRLEVKDFGFPERPRMVADWGSDTEMKTTTLGSPWGKEQKSSWCIHIGIRSNKREGRRLEKESYVEVMATIWQRKRTKHIRKILPLHLCKMLVSSYWEVNGRKEGCFTKIWVISKKNDKQRKITMSEWSDWCEKMMWWPLWKTNLQETSAWNYS